MPQQDKKQQHIVSEHSTAKTTSDNQDMTPLAKILFGWVEWKATPLFLLIFFLLLSAALIIIDLLYPRHYGFAFEHSTGFYGIFGFCAFTFVVLMGWPLRLMLGRPEDYYDGDYDAD